MRRRGKVVGSTPPIARPIHRGDQKRQPWPKQWAKALDGARRLKADLRRANGALY